MNSLFRLQCPTKKSLYRPTSRTFYVWIYSRKQHTCLPKWIGRLGSGVTMWQIYRILWMRGTVMANGCQMWTRSMGKKGFGNSLGCFQERTSWMRVRVSSLVAVDLEGIRFTEPSALWKIRHFGFYLHSSYLICIRYFFIPMVRLNMTSSWPAGNRLFELSNTISTDNLKKKKIIHPAKQHCYGLGTHQKLILQQTLKHLHVKGTAFPHSSERYRRRTGQTESLFLNVSLRCSLWFSSR